MIFLAYIIFGVLLAAIAIIGVSGRPNNQENISFKTNFFNTLTLIHVFFYLILSIYVIVRIPLPVYAFNQYLFIDRLAIYEVLISSIVFLLASIYGRGYVKSLIDRDEVKVESLGLFYGSFNLLLVIITFCFFSNNLALFWILLELSTILSAVLIVMLKARENIIAALKYVFIASTAMLFSVVGLIILFAISKQITGVGTLNWNELMAEAKSLPPSLFTFAFTFAFIGFASKAGITPFHTWLPQAHAKAPSVVSTVLSAVLLNGGIYGILRLYAIGHLTESHHTISIIILIFGVLSIAIAAFSMLSRTNLKKLIGFSSIEHMGLVLVGIGIGTPVAIFWILFHILAHSLIKSLLFFSAGVLHHQYDSNYLQDMLNALKLQPLPSWGIIIGSIAVIGMPPFPVFFSKLFILTQVGDFSVPLLVIILVLLLVVAGAFAFLLIRSFTQQSEKTFEPYRVHWTANLAIILLLVAIIGVSFGFSSGISQALTGITNSLGF